MAARKLLQTALRRTGYHLTRWPLRGSLEAELQRVLQERSIAAVLDIGAHEGRYAQTLRRVGFDGRIISFEPAAPAYERLVAAASDDPLWSTRKVALGANAGEAELFEYVEHTELTSLRRPSVHGEAFGITDGRSTVVAVDTLDNLFPSLGTPAGMAFVKMDTQGHDADVIAGGAMTLRQVAALQVEVPTVGLYENAPSTTELLGAVFDLGFSLVGMFPVHVPRQDLIPVEFDGLFVR